MSRRRGSWGPSEGLPDGADPLGAVYQTTAPLCASQSCRLGPSPQAPVSSAREPAALTRTWPGLTEATSRFGLIREPSASQHGGHQASCASNTENRPLFTRRVLHGCLSHSPSAGGVAEPRKDRDPHAPFPVSGEVADVEGVPVWSPALPRHRM